MNASDRSSGGRVAAMVVSCMIGPIICLSCVVYIHTIPVSDQYTKGEVMYTAIYNRYFICFHVADMDT